MKRFSSWAGTESSLDEDVVAAAAVERVVAAAAEEDVVARAAGERVVAEATEEGHRQGRRRGIDRVVARARVHPQDIHVREGDGSERRRPTPGQRGVGQRVGEARRLARIAGDEK